MGHSRAAVGVGVCVGVFVSATTAVTSDAAEAAAINKDIITRFNSYFCCIGFMLPVSMLVVLSESPATMLATVADAAAAAAAAAEVDGETQRSIIGIAEREIVVPTNCISSSSLSLSSKTTIALLLLLALCSELLVAPSLLKLKTRRTQTQL